jgi:hypothetical protein
MNTSKLQSCNNITLALGGMLTCKIKAATGSAMTDLTSAAYVHEDSPSIAIYDATLFQNIRKPQADRSTFARIPVAIEQKTEDGVDFLEKTP